MIGCRRAGQRGHSLAELMLVVALLGVTVVAFTPFQIFLMHRLNDDGPGGPPAALSWAALHLAADARASLDTRVDGRAAVRFVLPGEHRVAWTASAGGAVVRTERSGSLTTTRRFPAVLDVGRPGGNLLQATLTDARGRARRVDVWLRHAGRR